MGIEMEGKRGGHQIRRVGEVPCQLFLYPPPPSAILAGRRRRRRRAAAADTYRPETQINSSQRWSSS